MAGLSSYRSTSQGQIPVQALARLHYGRLMQGAPSRVEAVMLARIAATWLAGAGALPERMGLSRPAFRRLQSRWFGGRSLPEEAPSGRVWCPDQAPEAEDLLSLLLADRACGDPLEEWLASMLVAACQGGRHLWEDLGVWSRPELTALLRRHFPALARANRRDMKWKKFLYRRLCDLEGLTLCRAPTCDQCHDFSDCFGPEERPSPAPVGPGPRAN